MKAEYKIKIKPQKLNFPFNSDGPPFCAALCIARHTANTRPREKQQTLHNALLVQSHTFCLILEPAFTVYVLRTTCF